MRLIFLHGPVASGKLTIARALAERTGLPLFHNHLVVDALLAVFPFGSDEFVSLRETMWNQVFDAALAARQSLIFTFAPERTVAHDFPSRLAARIAKGGGQVDFVAVTCPRAVRRERLEDRSRHATGKLSSLELFDRLDAEGAFAYPELPVGAVTVDSSQMTSDEAAAVIADGLALGIEEK